MKELSFFKKLFISYFLIITILSAVIIFSSFRVINKHYINYLTTQLKNSSLILKKQITPLLINNEYRKIDSLVKELEPIINTRITIVRPDGEVIGDSEENPEKMENHKDRPEIKEALNNQMGRSLRFSKTVSENMLYIAIPINKNGEIIGIIRTSLFLREIDKLLNQLKSKVFYTVLIITILSLLGIYIFSNSLSKPIRKIIKASKEITKGNYNIKITITNKDEFKDLADSFNQMISQIKKLFSQLSYEKEHLQNILYNIEEGIIVLDKNGVITLANKSIKEIIENQHLLNKTYWKELQNPGINELVEQVIKEKNSIIKEVDLNDKTFLCSASFLSSNNEIVLIFHNITERQKLKIIKKDFVASVSHELRTPLTAIKGFVETIYENKADKKTKHYLDIIKKHTDRLIYIIEDLMTLSKLEKKGQNLELEKMNLHEMLNDIANMFEVKLKQKSLKLKIDIKREASQINADSFQLEKIFINLIDNAIKYTDSGQITINIFKIKNLIHIEIEDTGIGIPKNHIPRIFERFYVVDKSRSRQFGGTGLGLSIVKHIVLLHNGQITVESEPEKGTKFIILLPQ